MWNNSYLLQTMTVTGKIIQEAVLKWSSRVIPELPITLAI